MSPASLGWRKLPLILIMLGGLLAAGLAVAPVASAEPVPLDGHFETVTYDCMSGQTVSIQPGPLTVWYEDPSTGAKSLATVTWANVAIVGDNASSNDGVISADGHSASFTPYTGRPVAIPQELELWFNVYTEGGNTADYTPSTYECEGEATDTDGDGVPDDVDACPTESGTSPNGCPSQSVPPQLSFTTTTAHTNLADGSITVTVTNPVDSLGQSVTYSVEQDAGVVATVGPVADGASQTATWSAPAGTFTVCALGNDGTQACESVTVASDPTPALTGDVSFQNACFGIRSGVMNTGWQSATFRVEYRDYTGQVTGQREQVLAPGEFFFYDSTREYGLRAVVSIPNGSLQDIILGTHTWSVPAGCQPMKGGATVISWGKDLTKSRGVPVITVQTKAPYTKLGFQWKKGSPVAFVKTVGPGVHKLQLSKVPRHTKRCFRIWAKWGDGTTSPISGWHCYRRP